MPGTFPRVALTAHWRLKFHKLAEVYTEVMRENDQNLGGAQRCGPQNTCPLIQFTIESAAKAGQLLNLTHFHHVLPVARVVFSFCLCRVAKGSSTSFLQWQKNLCISTLLLYFITHLQILFAKHRKPDHNLMMKY
jgi:hypothetical protein